MALHRVSSPQVSVVSQRPREEAPQQRDVSVLRLRPEISRLEAWIVALRCAAEEATYTEITAKDGLCATCWREWDRRDITPRRIHRRRTVRDGERSRPGNFQALKAIPAAARRLSGPRSDAAVSRADAGLTRAREPALLPSIGSAIIKACPTTWSRPRLEPARSVRSPCHKSASAMN